MKKLYYVLALAFIATSLHYNVTFKSDKGLKGLFFVNNNAVANGEVIVGPLCAHISMNVCFIENDGWVLLGERSS